MPIKNERAWMATGAGVVVILAVVYAIVHRPSNNANFPNGTWWMCQNPTCKNEFVLTVKQLGDHYKAHYGQAPFCPKCGENHVIRAYHCPSCGTTSPMQGLTECPKCGKPVVIE